MKLFVVHIFPYLNLCIQSGYGKCGPEKTPYLDTFHAVQVDRESSFIYVKTKLQATFINYYQF